MLALPEFAHGNYVKIWKKKGILVEMSTVMHILRILFVGLFPQVILLTSFWELIKEIREDKTSKGDAEAGDLAVKILGIVIILAFEAIVLWRCIPIVIESVQGLLPK